MDGDPASYRAGVPPGGNAQNVNFFSFLTTYPSPTTTLTLLSHLGENVA